METLTQAIDSLVRLQAVSKKFGNTVALQPVSLEIRKGALFGLIGPDGAGKSTLLKIIAGVLAHDAGEVTVLGRCFVSEADAERVKTSIGFLPQGLGLNLYPDLSIDENIDFFAKLRLVNQETLNSRKERFLSMTRLTEFRDRPMKNLSGGMKQKLGLICTLIHQPELIILDEPTTGVDPVSRREFWNILNTLINELSVTAIVSTAYMDEAERFHSLCLLHQGSIIAKGTPDNMDVTSNPSVAEVFLAQFNGGVISSTNIDFTQKKDRESNISYSTNKSLLTDTAIVARSLGKQYGSFKACDDVSFTVPAGEIFGLLGANGAGKTTAIKMLTGIQPPSSGEGWVAGIDIRKHSMPLKQKIGYMSQAFSLYTDLTVIENLTLYGGIHGLSSARIREKTSWVLKMAALENNRHSLVSSLPMGLRQRLALGCALIHEPAIVFLDEPTSGVDPIGRQQFWDILFYLSRECGVAILITTHYMSEAENCDHIALMYAGKVVADASPNQLKQRLIAQRGELLAITCDRLHEARVLLHGMGFESAEFYGNKIYVFSKIFDEDAINIERNLNAQGIHVTSIERRPVTMEDVFVNKIRDLEDGS